MTIAQFKDMMVCNEPSFGYRGQEYSICWPDGKYYVYASDSPADIDLEFDTLDDLLEHWIIQGKPLKDVLEEIDLT